MTDDFDKTVSARFRELIFLKAVDDVFTPNLAKAIKEAAESAINAASVDPLIEAACMEAIRKFLSDPLLQAECVHFRLNETVN